MTVLDPQRALNLRFQGDWGGVNLTRICGWIAQGLEARAGAHTRSHIRTGRGMGDNLAAVHRGEVDVAVSTPAGFAAMARAGKGMFVDEPLPLLRAIGSLPHADALLIAIGAKHGVKSFAELREKKPALKLALAPADESSFMGLGARIVLEAHGITLDDIVDWGGELFFTEQPQDAVADVMSGKADSIIQEAIMTPWWKDMTDKFDFDYLSLDPDAEQSIEEEYALKAVTVKSGRLRGIDSDLRGVSFEGWMVVVREDMRDDVAGLIATIMVETSDFFEHQYSHRPVELSPLDYPMTPERLADVPIPLHPGAEAYYKSIKAI
jgi:TRAP-type uncharacterized transport system substrate-binding protein